MANVKISALPAATSVAAADTLPIVQSATTKKATFQNVIDTVVSNEPGTSFRNRIINGDFSINQRAFTSSTTSATYGFDRWFQLNSGGTATYSTQTFTLGNAITGQEPSNHARLLTSGQSAAGDYALLGQRIESVRTFAGQTVTISFWAKAASGTPKIAVEAVQGFGTGGSPSADVNTALGQVTISTSWARYSVTGSIPSISGKTIGTGSNDSIAIFLWVSAGSTFNSRTGSMGIQNGTFDIWGVQVEAGSTASAFERRPQQVELALCQRYYQRFGGTGQINNNHITAVGTAASTTLVVIPVIYPVPMRAAAAVSAGLTYGGTLQLTDGVNYPTTGALSLATSNLFGCGLQVAATGATQYRPHWLYANGDPNAYFAVSAEL